MATARERRYWASKEKRIRFKTVEFYHEDFGVLRYVLNQFTEKTFTLESGAPRNPSEAVVFSPLAGDLSELRQTTEAVTRELTLGRVGSNIKSTLEQITLTGRTKPAEMIVRYYISGEASAPSNTPEIYYVASVNIGEQSVSLIASDDIAYNSRVARVYREDEFTGMQGFLS